MNRELKQAEAMRRNIRRRMEKEIRTYGKPGSRFLSVKTAEGKEVGHYEATIIDMRNGEVLCWDNTQGFSTAEKAVAHAREILRVGPKIQ